ncbi:MAG: nitrogen regulation protein NR(II) [Kofleriaceae bacterium]
MAETAPLPVTRIDPAVPTPADSLVGPPIATVIDLRRRVSRLLLLRTLVITIVLVLTLWLIATTEQSGRAAVWLQTGIIAASYLTSIVFGVLLRKGAAPRRVARPMHAADLIVASLLVFLTGGAQSPYVFLYALSVVAAGALSYRRGAVTVTIASLILMTTMSVLAWTHVFSLPFVAHSRPWEQTSIELIRTIGLNFAALVGVGALSFIFGDQLQRGAETLATTRQAAADLLSLHQDIIRSLSSGLITTSPDGTVLTANQAAGEILRRDVRLLIGSSISSLMPGLSEQLAGSDELRRGDLALDVEARKVFIGVSVSPLRDVRDRTIGRIVNFQDLTELRRLEAQNRRSERLATVGQLAAGIAHEIRNPLASISGSIELLKQVPQASDDDRTLMAIVQREVQRLNVLIGDLLDYANPRTFQKVEFDLATMVEETVQVARADPTITGVEIASEVDRPLRVHADPAKLRQVLWNLIRNAAEAASTAGNHVRVEARADGDRTAITVADDGPGISQHQLTHIFDPFFTTKSKGTGLGLATCHSLIAEHGGRIDVESELGKGTKMVVRLPREG